MNMSQLKSFDDILFLKHPVLTKESENWHGCHFCILLAVTRCDNYYLLTEFAFHIVRYFKHQSLELQTKLIISYSTKTKLN